MSTLLRMVQGPEDLAALEAAAKADGHEVLRPTHLIVREATRLNRQEEIIGGIGCIPMIHWWAHTTKMQARDTVRALAQLEAMCPGEVLCFPCPTTSPYRPVMPKLGFHYGWEAGLFFKRVTTPQHRLIHTPD